jgi:cellulose synthase/poly-beta-1,6-N-acetylglucosamine synthase-like glycosyltransferase
MKLVFWVSVAFVAYTYLGYPLWLYLLCRWWPRPIRAGEIFPRVSMVMAVYNEEKTLPRKLLNLRQLEYPQDRFEIIVISDGSTDATNKILKAQTHSSLRVVFLPEHQGKGMALNRGIELAEGDIVVFTDARQLIKPDALRHLVAPFADESVGCVSADITLGEPNSGAPFTGVGLYWQIETNIRRWEGARGHLVGAAGCLYAVRRDLTVPLPSTTLLDDVYLPLQVARQGARIVFEPRARGWDCSPEDLQREFRRKVRTLTGNYQLLRIAPWLLSSANPLRFEFVCHKLLRLLVPFALAAIFFSSLYLRAGPYQLALLLQAIFYTLAPLAFFKPRLGVLSRLASISLAFIVLNIAAVVAFAYFLTGKREVWVR